MRLFLIADMTCHKFHCSSLQTESRGIVFVASFTDNTFFLSLNASTDKNDSEFLVDIVFPMIRTQSNYSLSGLAVQVFPVRGQGLLAVGFHRVSCSLRLHIRDTMTSSTAASEDHKTVTAEVENLEYESSGLDVSESAGCSGDSQLPMTTLPQPQTKEIEAVLFWRLAENVASKIRIPVTKCLQNIL